MSLEQVIHDFWKFCNLFCTLHCIFQLVKSFPSDLVVQPLLPLFPGDNLFHLVVFFSFFRWTCRA